MAKTRLNKTHRELLKNLANSKIVSPETQERIDIAFTAYQVMGEELQAKQFPASDMAILKKYECAKPQTQIGVLFHDKTKDGKTAHESVTISEVLHVDNDTWRTPASHKIQQPYDGKFHKLCKALKEAKSNHEEVLRNKKNDYFALIDNARTFEDVAEVWEEANELQSTICTSTALSVISKDVIVRIKKDTASRKEES